MHSNALLASFGIFWPSVQRTSRIHSKQVEWHFERTDHLLQLNTFEADAK